MKKIVVINGTGGSGKDTFVSLVSQYCKVYNFSSVEKVKEIAKMIGWGGEECKTDKDRKFLSDLKILTTEYNDMSYRDMCDKIAYFETSEDEIMFIHIREPKEIEKVVKHYNVITLLIKREGLDPIQTNQSDANVENYDYDFIIVNRTLEELTIEAKKFVHELTDISINKHEI